MRHNVIKFVALLLADVTDFTFAILYMDKCATFNIVSAFKRSSFVLSSLRKPITFSSATSQIRRNWRARMLIRMMMVMLLAASSF